MLTVLVFGLVVVLHFSRSCGADEVICYAPDGTTIADNETVVPCNKLGITQNGVHSSCCRLDGNADERDLCTTTGLCLNGGIIRREYCTDSTWKSPACVNVCTDPKSGGSASGIVELTACSDGTGTYCCGHNNLTCCGSNYAVVVPTQISVISSNETDSTPITGPGVFKTATIALTAILGVVLLAATLTFFWLSKKLRSLSQQTVRDSDAAIQATLPAAELHQQANSPNFTSNQISPSFPKSDGVVPELDTGSPSEMASPAPLDNYASPNTVTENHISLSRPSL